MDYEQIVKNLNQRRFIAKAFHTADEAKQATLEIIGNRSVGIGGTSTIGQMGLYDALIERGNSVYCHTYVNKSEKDRLRHAAINADVYLSSSNAITQDGVIVNIDGTGNRVTGLTYGPHTVIVIVGKNKIVKDVSEGITRTKRDCCPKNAKRLGLPTPCGTIGHCMNCNSTARMCNVTTIMEFPLRDQTAFYVFIVDEELGW